MSDYRWTPSAAAVKQVATHTLHASATQARATIGGVVITGDVGATAAATATNLLTAISAARHEYFKAIVWTVSSSTITATAKTGGCPFILTMDDYYSAAWNVNSAASTTACTGRNHYDDNENWRTLAGAITANVPAAGDNVYVDNSGDGFLWGCGDLANIDDLVIGGTFTGCIGVNPFAFCTDSGGKRTVDIKDYRALPAFTGDLLNIQGTPRQIMLNITLQGSTDDIRVVSSAQDSPRNAPAPICIWNGSTGAGTYVPEWNLTGNIAILCRDITTNLIPNIHAVDATIQIIRDGVFTTAYNYFNDIKIDNSEVTIDGLGVTGEIYLYSGTLKFLNLPTTLTALYQYGGTVDYTELQSACVVTTRYTEGGESVVSQSGQTVSAGTDTVYTQKGVKKVIGLSGQFNQSAIGLADVGATMHAVKITLERV